ncbi:MAG: CIA30 family protein [Pseudomonadota bacterium]
MKRVLAIAVCFGLSVASLSIGAVAQNIMLDNFENSPEARWGYVADTVMGGVSTGELSFEEEDGKALARLTGEVSTANRGGFIQFRRALDERPADGTEGVRLIARGNGERYFVHLRTTGTALPWQFYQAGFDTTPGWTEVRIPFSQFKASGGMLRSQLRAGTLKSIGIVAYGRDHEAEVEIQEIGFY